MTKYNWGILSTANIGQRAMIPALKASEMAEVSAVASRDLAKARRFADELEIEKTYGSYQELLDDDQVDAVYIPLPTLKYLAMGGRMGKLAAGLADTMEIKPILTMQEGKLDLLEKIRTLRKAKQRLLDLARESTAGSSIIKIGLIHVNNEQAAVDLFESLKEVLPISIEPIIGEFTPGLSVHAGSGVIGFVLITD